MNRRRATTLAELVICMSIGSSIMLLAIKVTHQTMTASSQTRQRGDVDRVAGRLAQQLRSDVHRAVDVSVEPDNLRIVYADETVATYEAVRGRITRGHRLADQQNEQEVYLLADDDEPEFRLVDEPKRIELIVRRRHDSGDAAPNTRLHVVAVVGKLVTAEKAKGTAQ